MAVRYRLSYSRPSSQYIDIEMTLEELKHNETILQLPAWRPGRYELGNFAKNVRKVMVQDAEGNPLPCQKVNKDRWKVQNGKVSSLIVTYQYYANVLNAGSTYLDEHQLYVNPVNCMMYCPEFMDQQCEVTLDVPSFYTIACALKEEGQTLVAENFHQLADSPFIASRQITHHGFTVKGYRMHLWFNGEVRLDLPRLERDFSAFIALQIEAFGEFPVPEYHFLFQIKPEREYHGVEHLASTVLALGPSYDLMKGIYNDLVGVCSHEIYHSWNIKMIRPAEMQPYDYTKENYTRLGYVAEGVTTYMGDLFLYRSGVFSNEQFFAELSRLLNRHFDNDGRHHYSVAESSFDTWLDGYEPGAPGRKVSIYTEGALLAMACDVMIRRATHNFKGLDDVMRNLYYDFACKGKGYTENDYREQLEKISGIDFKPFFKRYVYGTDPFDEFLEDVFNDVGLKIVRRPARLLSLQQLGVKTLDTQNGETVKMIATDSPAEQAGMMLDDVIVAINGYQLNKNLEEWLGFFKEDQLHLTLARKGRIISIMLQKSKQTFFDGWDVDFVSNPTAEQQEAFQAWTGRKILQ